MKPKIYIFMEEENGKVSIETEQLKRFVDEIYQQGYDDGLEAERSLNHLTSIDPNGKRFVKTVTREDIDKAWDSLYDTSKWKHKKD